MLRNSRHFTTYSGYFILPTLKDIRKYSFYKLEFKVEFVKDKPGKCNPNGSASKVHTSFPTTNKGWFEFLNYTSNLPYYTPFFLGISISLQSTVIMTLIYSTHSGNKMLFLCQTSYIDLLGFSPVPSPP